ncbi:hypothetical protein PHMEG_00032778 [Phytophthora megakarya]|uniref:Transmembrane protein n=1 Tax=Phytophthora megakarya TaxID=4795 RepID=A0A225UVP7_9STRA|nr:hypothetical protein PHMEG_00032778 [Phytophthora megakarya]
MDQYFDPVLWPMHVFTTLCVIGGWTLTTPYRAVLWNFGREAWRVIRLNVGMWADFAHKYQLVVQDPTVQQLRGWEYAGALGGAAISVPSLVLTTEEDKYGRYGRMHSSVYGPMALYDVLEYLCCGGLGVVAMLAVLNMLNYLFHWTSYGVYASSVIIVVGVLTHAWRQGRPEGYLEEVAPGAVLELALKSVRKDAKTRQRREAESLRQR